MAIESVALPKLPLDTIPEARFYIPATGPATRPRRTLKHGNTFIVVDSHGDIGASAGGTDGLFFCDTRFLSHLELLLNGMQPLLLGSNVRDDNTQLTVDLTNPDIYFDQRLVLPKDTLHVVRTIFLWRDTAYQRIGVRNYGDHAIDLRLSILFDSDFADLFEVRGLHRTKHGHVSHSFRADRALLNYDGLDGKQRQTALSFDPPPTELTATSAAYAIHLPAKAAKAMFLTVGCGSPAPPRPVPFLRGLRKAHRERRISAQNASTVVSSNDIFNEVVCRSLHAGD
jgi:glycogen debranching enzyme